MLRRQLAASPQMVTRFVREAQAVNMIKHPAIVDIYEFDTLPDGRPFYVMELLEGTDVRSLLNERGRFTPAEVLEILEPVCSALQVAHEQGIVHRDLKASNIFVKTSGGTRSIKLLDFGIAKLMHPDASEAGLTVVGTRLGTSYTMAPEQIRGDGVDPRTDIYALGVVLYHLLTGQYPFRAETMTDIERMHLEAPPPRPSQAAAVSPAFDAVVLRCMEKTAERRYQSVKAFIEALREAVGTKTDKPEITRAGRRHLRRDPGRRRRRRRERRGPGRHLRHPRRHGTDLPRRGAGPAAADRQRHHRRARPARRRQRRDRPRGGDRSRARAGRRAGRPARRPSPRSTSTSRSTSPARSVKESAEAPDGKEIVGGDILSTADWAPQEDTEGVHLTASAS